MKPIPLQLVTVCLDNGQQGVFVGVPLVAEQSLDEDGQIEDIWFSDVQEVPAQMNLADLIGLVLFWALVPRLTTRFQQKTAVNALIIGGVFLLFCLAVFFVRRLQGETEGAYIDPGGLSVFLGVMFGIFVSFMMAEAAGVFDNLDTMDLDTNNPAVSVGILAVMLAWLVLIFLYPGILMARKIANALSVDLNYLVSEMDLDEPDGSNDPPPPALQQSPALQQFIELRKQQGRRGSTHQVARRRLGSAERSSQRDPARLGQN